MEFFAFEKNKHIIAFTNLLYLNSNNFYIISFDHHSAKKLRAKINYFKIILNRLSFIKIFYNFYLKLDEVDSYCIYHLEIPDWNIVPDNRCTK